MVSAYEAPSISPPAALVGLYYLVRYRGLRLRFAGGRPAFEINEPVAVAITTDEAADEETGLRAAAS